jgi:hypothetical protein
VSGSGRGGGGGSGGGSGGGAFRDCILPETPGPYTTTDAGTVNYHRPKGGQIETVADRPSRRWFKSPRARDDPDSDPVRSPV